MRGISRGLNWLVDGALDWVLVGWLLLTWAGTVVTLFIWAPWWTAVVWLFVGLPFVGTMFAVISDGR